MTVDFTIVVPYGANTPGREASLAIVREHLTTQHPDWSLCVSCIDGSLPWSKGLTVAKGVEATTTDGLIIHDADVVVAPAALRRAALAVVAGAAWAMPHGTVYRLSRRGTARAAAGQLGPLGEGDVGAAHLERARHFAPPGGGCTVLSRAAWDATGGIDPRFLGWGGEDISWARALDTLVGPGVRGDAPMWHLWHEPDPTRLRGGRALRGNERLASQYLDAVNDPEAMRAVVAR